VVKYIIVFLGSLLAYLPRFVAHALAGIIGWLLYTIPGSRKRLVLSNLHHAFPEKKSSWRRKIARRSCQSVVELGMFLLASPYFSKKRMRESFSLADRFYTTFRDIAERKKPIVVVIPHFTHADAISMIPCLTDAAIPETGTIYRPLKNAAIEQWVRETRSKFGVKMLSRKEGFSEAIEILRSGGAVAVLFDQNAGYQGILTTFMGRLASSTELPGLLAKKFNADVYAAYTNRKGFWQAEIDIEKIDCDSSESHNVVFAAGKWLEEKLRSSEVNCGDWLWLHNRWGTQNEWSKRFGIKIKRNALEETKAFYNQTELPRTTRFWFRMPNWLGDVLMAIPLIRAVRKSRPDAEITLIAKDAFMPFLKRLGIAENYISLPNKNNYWRSFWQLRNQYPDTYFLFTNSFRGDMEAFLTRCPQRFGMLRAKKLRPLLTHTWKIPKGLDETMEHQTDVWRQCFDYFGFDEKLELSPLQLSLEDIPDIIPLDSGRENIGLICGTENNPSKRWPVEYWRSLIHKLIEHNPSVRIFLFGTIRDAIITKDVATGFPTHNVKDLAGETNMLQFAKYMQACEVVVCNDTGGMHIANALGVPVIAIFGPTNPLRTGPVFNAPKIILQPYHCPLSGGMPIHYVTCERVFHSTLSLLEKLASIE